MDHLENKNADHFILGCFSPFSREVTDLLKHSLTHALCDCLPESKDGKECLTRSSENHKNCSPRQRDYETCTPRCAIENMFALFSLPPKFTTVRINLLKVTIAEAQMLITDHLKQQYKDSFTPIPSVYPHPLLPDLLIVESHGLQNIKPAAREVVVDQRCGSALLRGAEVFAPGVLCCPPGLQIGDTTAVVVDVDGVCLRGSKTFYGRKIFVGNGVVAKNRKELFTSSCSGIAVAMKEKIFDAPSLGNCHKNLLFLQNLPSVLCGHTLKPSMHSRVLDMCAAPGGKTTHLATLMSNTGVVIAIDRSQNKLNQIVANADNMGLTNIKVYKYDSRKLVIKPDLAEKKDFSELKDNALNSETFPEVSHKIENDNLNAPPYGPSSFKRILLDAPCSALGQRPQINSQALTSKEVKAFTILQRNLLATACELLEVGGKLVYSTCTITTEENEKVVKWCLDTFPNMELEDCGLRIGQPGLPSCGLDQAQCVKVRRFGPSFNHDWDINDVNRDTIGFFIAAFTKIS